ncbi:mitochondrial transcription rescue factor 1 isoform X2 [Conger conger]|nr:mitochondrial transcription rescue factor 1 isoform X2 [Conger conger]XP_061106264.1 mitochondrial transcription rescue factor 1 isoform X2 [Conger conger]
MRCWRAQALIWRRLAGLSTSPRDASVRASPVSGACTGTTLARQVCSAVSPATLRTPLAPALWTSARSWCSLLVRFKTTGGSKKGGKNAKEDEEEEEDDPAASDYEDELQDDPGLPKNYKDQERSVQSFRYDLILKAGLDLARNKIDDAFYGNKLRLNGQRLIKKSKTVKVGDTLDLVLEDNRDTDVVTLMRVVLKEVVAVTRDEARYRVVLRRWKHLQLPRQEAYRL